MSSPKIPVAISSCLMGDKVRFDASHKQDRYLIDTLGAYFEYTKVCPEVAIGMSIPRPPIRLVSKGEEIRVLGVKDASLDVTQPMADYAEKMATDLSQVCGYIFKSKSPSCGMERVKLYHENGVALRETTSGLYANIFMQKNPLIPCEEEGRLNDPGLRENFMLRVYALWRWKQLENQAQGFKPKDLVAFHSRYKYLLMMHNEAIYRQMGPLVAQAGKSQDFTALRADYLAKLMACLAKPSTRKRRVNVLLHVMGYLKKALDKADKSALLAAINDYHQGHVPLIVPMRLMADYFRRHPNDYAQNQYLWEPYPAELGLRNAL